MGADGDYKVIRPGNKDISSKSAAYYDRFGGKRRCTFDALIDWVTGPRPACLILNRSINHPVQTVAATADLGTGSEITVARTPPKETAGAFGEAQCVVDLKQTIAAAAESVFKVAGSFAEGHNKTVTTAAADSVFQSADSALSWIVSASSEILEEAKVKIEWAKDQYATA
ncbi:hypothetical protein MUK42_34059 [Musa troglodytarum]|uniref:Uncharacterized protein n=1 Tax=Musa troglodytarum TaxID=320322 RepID=A0A9E7EET2_9LILI|nr:hypothetical protein MUK42_34059 [Musa troglodytarum]